MLTIRDAAFSAAGALGAFLIYLIRRKIEKRSQREGVELDQIRLNLIESYLANRSKWEPAGWYVVPPASIEGLITTSMTPKQWEDVVTALAGLHIRAVYTGCMYIEAIAVKYSEYAEALDAHRQEYVRWYSNLKDRLPTVFDRLHPKECRSFHAYFYRITDPTEANIEGFFAALNEVQKAIESGEIQILK